MAKLQSRNEIFKNDIIKKNQFIAENKGIFNFDAYVHSCLEELIKIDNDFYTNLKKRLSSEYGNFQFHLDHDIVSDSNNYEILALIDEVLNYLKEIETKDIGLFDSGEVGAGFDERSFYVDELEELYLELIKINNSYWSKFKESHVFKTNYAGNDDKTLAKNLLSNEKTREVAVNIDKTKNKKELISKINEQQNLVMHELERNKKKFKIKTKKFIIAFSFFVVVGIIGILLSLLIK